MKDNFIAVAVTIALILLFCGGIIGVSMGAKALGINLTAIFMILFLGLFMVRLVQFFEGGEIGAVVWWGWWLAFSSSRFFGELLRGSEHTWVKIWVDGVVVILVLGAIYYQADPAHKTRVESALSAFLRRFYRP